MSGLYDNLKLEASKMGVSENQLKMAIGSYALVYAMVVLTLILLIKMYIDHKNKSEGFMRFGNPLQEADNLGQARVDSASRGGPVQVYY